jgi:hypothetical protein
MRKFGFAAFCTLTLCILLLIVNIGAVLASEPGYDITELYGLSTATVDGQWGSGEWTPELSWIDARFNASNAIFAYKMDSTSVSGSYFMSWIIEWNDNTTDAGDMWIICIDGLNDNGTNPQANDVKIQITGHTTLDLFVGDGLGWIPMTNTTVYWANSLTTSPYNSVNHWVLEVQADKGTFGTWGASAPPQGLFIAIYDANTSKCAAWPPTTPNIPDRWGRIATYTGTQLPESLTVGVLVLLSSAAIILGSFVAKKRQRVANSPVSTIN